MAASLLPITIYPFYPFTQSIKNKQIMQNKPNLPNAQMNVTSFIAKDYEKTGLSDKGKTNPIQTQYKANTNPIPKKPK